MHSNRGPLIIGLGGGSILLIFLSVAPGALALGVAAWIMGKNELTKLNAADQVNDNDILLIKIGYGLGVAGAFIGGILTLVGLIMLLFFKAMFKAFFGSFFSMFSDLIR